MIYRTTRLRLRRQLKRQKKQVEIASQNAEQNLEKHFFKRLNNLGLVWRFLSGWVFLLSIIGVLTFSQTSGLGKYYQKLQYVPGGVFSEGMLGSYTNANPIFAISPSDQSVSRLVFGSLLKHDGKGKLVADQAESWQPNEKGDVFTVNLRKDVYFHDGQKMTAADVVYTINSIQDQDTKSPLRSSWQDIKISQKDEFTVVFTLPNSLASFPESLSIGILPKHILGKIKSSQLRGQQFNTSLPIGAGPFKWKDLSVKGDKVETRTQTISLSSNTRYYLGAPKLDQFVIKTYRSQDSLLKDYSDGSLTAMVGSGVNLSSIDKNSNTNFYNISTLNSVNVFFRMTSDQLKDVKVRKALSLAMSPKQLVGDFSAQVKLAKSPILEGQIGYNQALLQSTDNLPEANKILEELGWRVGSDGFRAKDGKTLELSFASQDSEDYRKVSNKLAAQWRRIGVRLKGYEILRSSDEIQGIINNRTYDVLLYGVSIGSDPDVFAYWHSTQADPRSQGRLNLSEYKSSATDKALEAGRTRLDPIVRATKYKQFLENWRNDFPAVTLYQPAYSYVAHNISDDFNSQLIARDTDRYTNVQNWMIIKSNVAR